MKTIEVELAVAQYFNPRQNIVVPNVSWGFKGMHECDLFVLSKAGYASEIEIKVSKSDLMADKKKKHGHVSKYIKNLFFAIPEKLYTEEIISHIPERAGILMVKDHIWCGVHTVKKMRDPVSSKTPYKLSQSERMGIMRLATMRTWTLKKKIIKMMKEIADAKSTTTAQHRG